ncbi:hypothetical protein K3152_11405 [Qipengyuania sp. 1NDH17]|uniref:Uncharacterized protein n=1 Tax=Qipengyuania polymorpha TaxID=2867234 RepID=A0ABS7IZ58_9SPHN|nr:hypothetical protein [Qipengyuania polymorpha]MBX7458853.1 hypothetical protein [Qipengyuania polymorpha]
MLPAVLSMASYPTPTHAVMIDLPAPYPHMTPTREGSVQRISVSSLGEPMVNGMVADRAQFANHLEWIAQQPIAAEVIFEPAADAPYGASLQVLAALADKGLTRFSSFCFGGIEQHRKFDKGDGTPLGILWHPPEPDVSPLSNKCSELLQPVP